MSEIRVLSAGAIKTGLGNLAAAFEQHTGHRVVIAFATAPVLRGRVLNGEASADVTVAPLPAMEDFEKRGSVLSGTSAVLGRVRAAVVVRRGAREPDVSTAVALKEEILNAASLVYNSASSGIYIEKLMERLGIAREVADKTTRVPTGGAVMKHLAGSRTANELGFGQVPEILVYKEQGVKLVGPLPEEVGNVTTYAAGVLSDAGDPILCSKFIRFLTTPSARETFKATGVE